jgi:membrane-associated phospholipid phosphatase
MGRAAAILVLIRTSAAILTRAPRPMPTRVIPIWRRFWIPWVFAGCVVALSMALFDAPTFEFASGLPGWLIDMFDAITDFGRSGWVLVPVGGLIVLITVLASPALDRVTRAVLAAVVVRLGYIFVAVGLPGLIATIVKRLIGRVRPSTFGPFAYDPLSWRPDFASLPSGHATTAFAALVAIGALVPRARPFLWLFAVVIAVSRVVVGAHFLSDVIAGAAFGAFGAVLVRDWFAVRRLGFHVTADGSVYANPGPSWWRIKRVAAALLLQ